MLYDISRSCCRWNKGGH